MKVCLEKRSEFFFNFFFSFFFLNKYYIITKIDMEKKKRNKDIIAVLRKWICVGNRAFKNFKSFIVLCCNFSDKIPPQNNDKIEKKYHLRLRTTGLNPEKCEFLKGSSCRVATTKNYSSNSSIGKKTKEEEEKSYFKCYLHRCSGCIDKSALDFQLPAR